MDYKIDCKWKPLWVVEEGVHVTLDMPAVQQKKFSLEPAREFSLRNMVFLTMLSTILAIMVSIRQLIAPIPAPPAQQPVQIYVCCPHYEENKPTATSDPPSNTATTATTFSEWDEAEVDNYREFIKNTTETLNTSTQCTYSTTKYWADDDVNK